MNVPGQQRAKHRGLVNLGHGCQRGYFTSRLNEEALLVMDGLAVWSDERGLTSGTSAAMLDVAGQGIFLDVVTK